MKSFRDLRVWQAAMQLVTTTYQVTQTLPDAERYGLTSQIRRSEVSIPSNIAETFGRFTRRDEARFLVNARGSPYELDTQLEIALNLGYLKKSDVSVVGAEIRDTGRMLAGLIGYVREQDNSKRLVARGT